MLNNKETPMNDTTNKCLCDCGVRATVPSETTVSRESRHDSKQLCNSERNLSDRDTRASTTFSGEASTAVPHVPDVRTITRPSKRSIDVTQTTGKKNRSIETAFESTRGRGRVRSFEGANRRKECAVLASFIPRATNTTGRAPYPGTCSNCASKHCR